MRYLNFFFNFIFIYSALLLRRPMITQCVTAAVLFGAGDVIAQQAVEGRGKHHDVKHFPCSSGLWLTDPFHFSVFKDSTFSVLWRYLTCLLG